jgi:pimeloyl-ACP methyl ester carboxylesterase
VQKIERAFGRTLVAVGALLYTRPMPLLALYRELVRRRYLTESEADEVHRVRCDDGVTLSLKRFRANPAAPKRHLPILCVPGLGADSTNFDAPMPYGVAPYLAQNGFDTWVVDLRGTGMSSVDGPAWKHITFDDFVARDIPATLEHIARITGADESMWLGHSMGGLVLYAAMASSKAGRVRAGVTLGSPVGFPQGWDIAPFLKPLQKFADAIPGLHVQDLSRLFAPLALRTFNPWIDKVAVVENLDAHMARRLMYRTVQSIPRGVLLQFRDWINHDAFRSVDHHIDYRARLFGCQTPVLVVGAPRDGVARLDGVRRALDLLPNASWLLCSKSGGMSVDYGHIDVLFGTKASEEVYPRLLEHFVKHDVVATPRVRHLSAVGG